MKILEDYETEAEHAKRFDVDVRTLRRWRNLPNGLPYTTPRPCKPPHRAASASTGGHS
jgi:hypothetical protein